MADLASEIKARLTRFGAGDPQVPDERGELRAAIGTAIQRAVERATGRSLGSVDATEAYDGRGTDRIVLRRDPILFLSSVTINGTALTVQDLTATPTYPPPQVVMSETRGAIVRTDGVFASGARNVIVRYTAGLTSEEAPDLYEAVYEWAIATYKALPRIGVTSQTIAEITYGYTDKMPDVVRRLIGLNKRGFAA